MMSKSCRCPTRESLSSQKDQKTSYACGVLHRVSSAWFLRKRAMNFKRGVVLHFAGALHLLLDMFFKRGSGGFPESQGGLAFGLEASGKGFLFQLCP